MRIGLRFRAQHENDGETVVRLVSEQGERTDLVLARQGDISFVTTEAHYVNFRQASDALDKVRGPLDRHTGTECPEYVQQHHGGVFIPLREFTKKLEAGGR